MGLVAPSVVSEYQVGKFVTGAGTFSQLVIVLAKAKRPELEQDSKARQHSQLGLSS